MRNLLNFLARYNNLVIFIILEGIALYLLSTGNDHHNTVMLKGIRGLTTGVEERVSNTISYFRLRQINQKLANENNSLRNSVEELSLTESPVFYSVSDSARQLQYEYAVVKVINNSVNRQKNFFTIDMGKKQGLDVDMAVTDGNSIAGVIVGCSENFSVAMSLINIDFRLSARIRSNGNFGSLTWDGRDIRHAILNEIPQHVLISVGDTIETTGYSAIFPEGIMIGTISEFDKPGGDFYTIRVALTTDFRKLRFVNAVANVRKTEQHELENAFQ